MIGSSSATAPSIAARAEELFHQHLDAIRRQTDRLMAGLMAGQWLFAVVIAVTYSPYAWEGKTRSVHAHVWAATLLGGLISSLPIAMALLRPGATLTRYVIAVAQMLWSALLIHLTGGRIETHFHVFGSLAFLSFYRDWRVLVPATLVVAADHLIRQLVWPESVYGIVDPEWWRFVEHAFWVVFEDVFLVLACVRGMNELRTVAIKQADLEEVSCREREKSAQLDSALGEAIVARDAAEKANQVKSQFLANMSHELRTPIGGVIGMTELLGRSELNEKQQRHLETIRASGESLLLVVNDILDFSKMEAGKLALQAVDFCPAQVAHGVVDLLAPQAHSKGLEIACTMAPDMPSIGRGDPGRLQQVLGNLVSNAVKFTTEGEVVVRGSLVGTTAEHQLLRFEVSDTGLGIDGADRSRLFQAFSQVDSSHSRRYAGTGLGLAIARHLVELMGGEIGVDSEPGKGSTFWFTLRVQKAADPVAQPDQPVELRGRRILLVDDNETSRTILEEQLAAWSTEVVSVQNGDEALSAVREAAKVGRPFSLVITDMQMPRMTGLQLARHLRQLRETRATPIVMLTSVVHGPSERPESAGVSAWMSKPVSAERLRGCLADALRRSSLVPPSRPAVSRPVVTQRPRLLFAEDNPVNQEVGIEMLHELGYTVDLVDNGRDAVDAFRRAEYAAVLLDCQMPLLDGYETARAIRKHEPSGKHTPLIAVTAYALSGDRERALAAGMDDYMTKPLSLHALGQTLRRWLDKSQGCSDVAAAPSAGRVLEPAVRRSSRVRDLFMAQLGEWPTRLQRAVDDSDVELVRKEAHKFRGSCVSIGAAALAELCTRIERAPSEAALHLAELAAAIAATREALQIEIDRAKVEVTS